MRNKSGGGEEGVSIFFYGKLSFQVKLKFKGAFYVDKEKLI